MISIHSDKTFDSVDRKQLIRDLSAVMNAHSIDAVFNTPDFILGELLADTLQVKAKTEDRNAQWHHG